MRMRVDQDVPWPACIGNLSRETAIAFARAGRASDETTIAFADEKWAYLGRISVALVLSVSMSVVQGRALVMVVSRWSASAVVEVMAVSMVAVWGRALVMVVSCWSASVAAEVSLVSTSPRHSCLCAKKFALLGLMVGVSARGPVAGRTFSRVIPRGPAVGRTFSRVEWGGGCAGRIVSRMPVR